MTEELEKDGIRVESYSWDKIMTLRGKELATLRGKKFKITVPTTPKNGRSLAWHRENRHFLIHIEKDGNWERFHRAVYQGTFEKFALMVPTNAEDAKLFCARAGMDPRTYPYLFAILIELGMTYNIPASKGIKEKGANKHGYTRSGGKKSKSERDTQPVSKKHIHEPTHKRGGRTIAPLKRDGSPGESSDGG